MDASGYLVQVAWNLSPARFEDCEPFSTPADRNVYSLGETFGKTGRKIVRAILGRYIHTYTHHDPFHVMRQAASLAGGVSVVRVGKAEESKYPYFQPKT